MANKTPKITPLEERIELAQGDLEAILVDLNTINKLRSLTPAAKKRVLKAINAIESVMNLLEQGI